MTNYSIAITSFDKRFQQYLVPLIEDIKKARPNIEIILNINGPHDDQFNENYRKEVLLFAAKQDRCFPSIYTSFQSLAKMWNRAILRSTNEHILVLNDDLRINLDSSSPCFFTDLEDQLKAKANLEFKINNSFSHFFISKKLLIEVGFFDERLLGVGEEDGDFAWRYKEIFGKEFPSLEVHNIKNIEAQLVDGSYKKGIGKYSLFNREFITEKKYQASFFGHKSMFDKKVKKILDDEKQYPYENFTRVNKKHL